MAEADASLIIDLQARTAKLEKDLDAANAKIRRKMQTQGKTITRDLSTMFSKIGTIAAFAGVTVGLNQIRGAVLDVIDTSSALQTTADKLGLTTTALQELRYAGEQYNINQSTTDMALQRFSRRLAEAAQGGGELKATLDQYGIAVRDSNGQMRSTLDVLRDFADAVQGAESEQEQLRIAFKAFDSEGVSFVNILRDGAKGLSELTVQAHAFGGVIEAQQIRRLAELDKRLKDISGSWKTFRTNLVAGGLDVAEFLGIGGAVNKLSLLQTKINELQFEMALPANAKNPNGPAMEMMQRDLDKFQMQQEVTLSTLVRNMHDTRELINEELKNTLANRTAFEQGSDGYALLTRQIKRLNAETGELDEQEQKLMAKYPEMAAMLQDLNNLEEGRANALALTAAEMAQLQSILTSTVTAEERLKTQLQLLEKAIEAMPARTAEFEEAMKRLKDAYAESLKSDEIDAFGKEWESLGERISGSLSEAFIEGGDALDNFLERSLRKLAAAQLESAIFQPLFSGLFGGSGGGGFFKFGLPGFAGGGRAPVGSPYLVGENGPEIRVDNAPGTILPNRVLNNLSGTGSTGGEAIHITQHLHFDVGLESVDRRIASAAPLIATATEAKIQDTRRRRGKL